MREAAGWTQERLAEELGVLPAEMGAWESGAITMSTYQAAQIRWWIDRTEYTARLPVPDCEWRRTHMARLERMRETGPYSASQADREERVHLTQCAECSRVQALLRAAPPPPPRPARPGVGAWIARLPAWLRIPLQAGGLALVCGGAYLVFALLGMIIRPDRGFEPSFRSFASFLLVGTGIGWWFYLLARLTPLAARRPHLAAQLAAAGVALPATAMLGLLGYLDISRPWPWASASVFSAALGAWTGLWLAEDVAKELECGDDARPDGAGDVLIPQEGRSAERLTWPAEGHSCAGPGRAAMVPRAGG